MNKSLLLGLVLAHMAKKNKRSKYAKAEKKIGQIVNEASNAKFIEC